MRSISVTTLLRVSTLLFLAATSTLVHAQSQTSTQTKPIALVGGTLIDVTNFGNSTADLKDAVVMVSGDRVDAVGRKGKVRIPADAQVVDITGKYIGSPPGVSPTAWWLMKTP